MVDKAQLGHEDDNLSAICEPKCLENVGALMPYNLMDLHGLLQVQLYLYLFYVQPLQNITDTNHITRNILSIDIQILAHEVRTLPAA
jgi:hypothetical protein